MMFCPLCQHSGTPLYKDTFFSCNHCQGIYKNSLYYLSESAEIQHYKAHQNDVHDLRYQAFVSPITTYVSTHFSPHHRGLDFGSGTQPVISKMLQDKGHEIYQFDPFFSCHTELLAHTYDYIVSCEVIEHFHSPRTEFKLLRQMLNPNGHLICMTHVYDATIDFKDWYYKNDPTHVFFYSPETVQFIAHHFGFRSFTIDKRLITFKI